MTSSRSSTSEDQSLAGLYVNQKELLARLNVGEKAWRRALPDLERQGFPAQDPVFKKWFWPEVRAFLFDRHGISATMPGHDETDKEDWNDTSD